MDEERYQSEKRRILGSAETSAVFRRIRQKIEIDTSRPGHATQCPFSFSDANAACREWGWPDEPAHHDMALKMVQEYLLRIGWRFRVRNVVEANLLPDHHGYGVRADDVKNCRQWSGVISKTFDAVYAKGDKDGAKEAKNAAPPPRKEEKKEEKKKEDPGLKKSKSWKEKMGLKKKVLPPQPRSRQKKDEDGGNEDDDYFH